MIQQFNKISGEFYQGGNQVELLEAKTRNGFTSDAWVTFLQARDLGLRIKKGSKGVSIFKGYRTNERVTEKGEVIKESFPAGYATVFNLDQTEKGVQKENE